MGHLSGLSFVELGLGRVASPEVGAVGRHGGSWSRVSLPRTLNRVGSGGNAACT